MVVSRLILAAVLAAGAAGCGAEADRAATAPTPAASAPAPAASATPSAAPASVEQREVTDLLARYAAAIRTRDAKTICDDLLAASVLETVEEAGGDCARDLLADRIAEAGPRYELRVRSVRVTGDRAVAQTEAVESDGVRRAAQPLVRERGGWRLAAS